jgi:hypothetical protein
VIIVGTMGDDDVGLPLADQPRDGLMILNGRLQRPVMVIEDLEVGADELGAVFDLGPPAMNELGPRLFLVADVPVRHGHEFDGTTRGDPESGRPGRPGLAIIGVRPEADDPRLPVVNRCRSAPAGKGAGHQDRDQKRRSPV